MKAKLAGIFVIGCSLVAVFVIFFCIAVFAKTDADRINWKRQSRLVVDWAERMAREGRPIAEVRRFTQDDRDILVWGLIADEAWRITFESDDAGKVVDVQIDGYTVQEFRDIYTWLKEERR